VTEPTVRVITDDEFAESLRVVRTAFVSPPPTDEQVEARRPYTAVDRCHAAFDADGRMAGVARAFAAPITVPGGAELPCGAVSAVGVLPTHRRRGLLTGLMDAQLADVADRGEPLAALIAAEYPIYGRFGYGPATEAVGLHVDARVARWLEPPTGSVELVDNETFAKEIDALYDRVRRDTPGHIVCESERWRVHAGVEPWPDGDESARRDSHKVLWRDDAGEVQAAVAYRVDETWERNRPAGNLSANALVAADGRAEAEMLRFLASIDWVTELTIHLRPVDDPAPLALVDGRTAQLRHRSDHLWVRIVDVPAALGARRYAGPGSLVVEVIDPMGFAAGRFRLDGGPDGAECATTTDEPDLVVPARALAAAYLGGQPWGRLAAAGWVDEHRPGGVARAAGLFATVRAPWCAYTF
jgi:predicted acetyltransferase